MARLQKTRTAIPKELRHAQSEDLFKEMSCIFPILMKNRERSAIV
jgi:hypothetical protein